MRIETLTQDTNGFARERRDTTFCASFPFRNCEHEVYGTKQKGNSDREYLREHTAGIHEHAKARVTGKTKQRQDEGRTAENSVDCTHCGGTAAARAVSAFAESSRYRLERGSTYPSLLAGKTDTAALWRRPGESVAHRMAQLLGSCATVEKGVPRSRESLTAPGERVPWRCFQRM